MAIVAIEAIVAIVTIEAIVAIVAIAAIIAIAAIKKLITKKHETQDKYVLHLVSIILSLIRVFS